MSELAMKISPMDLVGWLSPSTCPVQKNARKFHPAFKLS
jgi:hypothetical protein